MHGQTCMASAADNGVDQDFDQDRDPASVAGRPGRATAPAVPERLWPTDRFAPDRDRDLCAVAPRLFKGRQRFPFHSGDSRKSPHARNTWPAIIVRRHRTNRRGVAPKRVRRVAPRTGWPPCGAGQGRGPRPGLRAGR